MKKPARALDSITIEEAKEAFRVAFEAPSVDPDFAFKINNMRELVLKDSCYWLWISKGGRIMPCIHNGDGVRSFNWCNAVALIDYLRRIGIAFT